MVASRHVEIERKYAVAIGAVLPTFGDTLGTIRGAPAAEFDLEAVYFDTADLDLLRHGVTLRRRTGGEDAGWHLKLPGGKDTRTEVALPLGRAVRSVPTALLPHVRALVRDRPLSPVARVSTRRLEYALHDDAGAVLATVCDDHVRSERLHGTPLVQEWREWEVELGGGSRSVLEAVETDLVRAGAERAAAGSKLAHALGDATPPVARTASRRSLARGSAAQLLTARVASHTARLHRHDAGVRNDHPESVHKLRIAARRLRSALLTYGPLVGPGAVDSMREELRWLGQALGGARDATVLRDHLDRALASEPADWVVGAVRDRIDRELDMAADGGRAEGLRALDSDRYFRLLDALDDFATSVPFTPRAQSPAKVVIPDLLQRDAKRLRRAVRTMRSTEDAHQHDLALHEVRKKAKRLRYAAESAVPVFGARATALLASTTRIQETLGRHQDAVVARDALWGLAMQAHRDGEDTFTFGRLHALEQHRAARAELDFDHAWANVRHRGLARWIRREDV